MGRGFPLCCRPGARLKEPPPYTEEMGLLGSVQGASPSVSHLHPCNGPDGGGLWASLSSQPPGLGPLTLTCQR